MLNSMSSMILLLKYFYVNQGLTNVSILLVSFYNMKSDTVQLILVRHGETHENAAGIVQGQLPGTLSVKGIIQAEAVGSFLSTHNINAIFTSDLARAWDTARIISASFPSIAVVADPRLREQHLGRFQGGPVIRLLRVLKKEGVEMPSFDPEDGESAACLRGRVNEFLGLLSERYEGKTVCLVTHHGFIQMFLYIFASWTSSTERAESGQNGVLTFVKFKNYEVSELWRVDCSKKR